VRQHFTHRDRQRLQRAADHYLRACFQARRPARVYDFASCLGVTAAYLSRWVSAATGKTASDLLRVRQLAYAAERLRATQLSVEEIALASAFRSRQTFHRSFLDVYGMTPAAYRRVMKRDNGRAVSDT
jgi:AraC-like DNA-binding protein